MPLAISEQELLVEIDDMNKNPAIHGILVQLPLPKHINEDAVIHAIAPEKDVDGFHPVNIGELWMGEDTLAPCTPTGCIILLKKSGIELAGKNAVVVGRSNIVGKPMAAPRSRSGGRPGACVDRPAATGFCLVQQVEGEQR